MIIDIPESVAREILGLETLCRLVNHSTPTRPRCQHEEDCAYRNWSNPPLYNVVSVERDLIDEMNNDGEKGE